MYKKENIDIFFLGGISDQYVQEVFDPSRRQQYTAKRVFAFQEWWIFR